MTVDAVHGGAKARVVPGYQWNGGAAKPWQLVLVRGGGTWRVDEACSLPASGQSTLCIGSTNDDACAVDPRPIGKLLGTNLTPAGSEDNGTLLYCYYKMSTPPDAGLRLGLLRCPDLGNYFNTVGGTATPTQVGGTAGQVKYDPSTDPPSGLAVAIAGGVGARADIQTGGDSRSAAPFSFDAATTLPAVAKMALSTYLTAKRGQPTHGSCA